MTMRLDIVTNDAGELVRREHARELGAGVVVAIYRLVKVAQMHDLGNQAFLRQLEQTHQMIGEYCLRSGSNVSVLFAHKATFVAGQLLKGNRGAYEAAAELGDLLERIGGSELHIGRDITREELNVFAEQVSLHYRTGSQVRLPPKMQLRRVADAARLRGIELESLTPDQRIVRAYASAVVIMRRFFEDLAASRYILPRRIKRIAQSLVDLSDAQSASYLGVTEVRNANYDEAGRAVNTAILAVAIAREATQNRTVLAQIAMAALMHDVARPRALALAGATGSPMPGMAGPTTLSEDQEDRLAAGAAAVLTALGRVNEPTVTRTVLTFEALWLRRRTWLGPVYWGARAPTLHASIIAIARRYNDLLTPEPGLPPPTTDFAVATLANELTELQDRTVLRMLVSALGLLPTGTLVQLSTGEVAEVTRGTRRLGEKPAVRVVADANGQRIARPFEVDLSKDLRRLVHSVLGVDGWSKGLERAATEDAGRDAAAESASPAVAARVAPPPPPDPSSSSLPSAGTSPSAVAEAMGRMISESLHPPPVMHEAAGNEPSALPAVAPKAVDEESAATARGNLAATPLPHVLVYMLDHALTGTVVFETGGGDAIYFVDGVPARMYVAAGRARLGEVLVESGMLDAATVERSVAAAAQVGSRLGEHLVRNDVISREALDWALEQQMLQRVALATNLPGEVTYAFYRDVDQLASLAGEVALGHPLSPILAAVRQWTDRSRVGATVSRIGKHPLAIHPDAELDGLRLTADEQAVVDQLRGETPPALSELLARQLADERTVTSLVYVLAVTRQLAFKGQKKGPMVPREGAQGRAAPPAAAVAPSAASPFSSSVNPFASAINPFSAPPPAVIPPAPPAAKPAPPPARPVARPPQIRPIGAKKSSPAILPGGAAEPSAPKPPPAPAAPDEPAPESSGDGRTIAQPPAAIREMMAARSAGRGAIAPGALAAPTKPAVRAGGAAPLEPSPSRPAAVGKLTGAAMPPTSVRKTVRGLGNEEDPEEKLETAQFRPPAPTPEEVMADEEIALQAMASFRLAEVALQRSDLATAEHHARKAYEADPAQPEYLVLLAWIHAQNAPQAVDEAIRTISKLLIEDPSNERALLYRGKLLARVYRPVEALTDINEILAVNPHHREALEVMRQLKAKQPG
jgi:hypothetical protein